jgi:hypothetical protein
MGLNLNLPPELFFFNFLIIDSTGTAMRPLT